MAKSALEYNGGEVQMAHLAKGEKFICFPKDTQLAATLYVKLRGKKAMVIETGDEVTHSLDTRVLKVMM